MLSTLPKQDFEKYSKLLNKRDGQTVRYRWKVILKRAKGEYQRPTTSVVNLTNLNTNIFLSSLQKLRKRDLEIITTCIHIYTFTIDFDLNLHWGFDSWPAEYEKKKKKKRFLKRK